MKNGLSISLLVLAILMAKSTARVATSQVIDSHDSHDSQGNLVNITETKDDEGYYEPESVHVCKKSLLNELKLSKTTSVWTPDQTPTILINAHHNVFSRIMTGNDKPFELTIQLYKPKSSKHNKIKKKGTHTPVLEHVGTIVTELDASPKDEEKVIDFKLPPHIPEGKYYIIFGQRADEIHRFEADAFINFTLTNKAYQPIVPSVSELNLITINPLENYMRSLPETFTTLERPITRLLPTVCHVCKLVDPLDQTSCNAISVFAFSEESNDLLTVSSVCKIDDLGNKLNNLKFKVFGLEHAKFDSSIVTSLREILKDFAVGTTESTKGESYFANQFCKILRTDFANNVLPAVYTPAEKIVLSDVHFPCEQNEKMDLNTVEKIMHRMDELAVPTSMVIQSPPKTDEKCNSIVLKVDHQHLVSKVDSKLDEESS